MTTACRVANRRGGISFVRVQSCIAVPAPLPVPLSRDQDRGVVQAGDGTWGHGGMVTGPFPVPMTRAEDVPFRPFDS